MFLAQNSKKLGIFRIFSQKNLEEGKNARTFALANQKTPVIKANQ